MRYTYSSVGGFLAAGFLIWHLPSALNSHTLTGLCTWLWKSKLGRNRPRVDLPFEMPVLWLWKVMTSLALP